MISSIKIRNFQQYKSVDICFKNSQDQVALILGNPGSGKTTLFNAIKWGISRFSYGTVDMENVVNVDLLSCAAIGDKLETLVEIEIDFQGKRYKSVKIFEAECIQKNKYRSKNLIFTVHQKINDEWILLNNDSLLPENYEAFMFLGKREFNNTGYYKYMSLTAEDAQVFENAADICFRAKKYLLSCITDNGSQEKLQDKLSTIEENMRVASRKKEELQVRLEECEEEIKSLKNKMVSFEESSELLMLKTVHRKLMDITEQRIDVLAEMKKYEAYLSKWTIDSENIVKRMEMKDTGKDQKIRELLMYLDLLFEWVKENKADKQEKVINELNVLLNEEINKMGLSIDKYIGMEKLLHTDSICQWEQVVLWIALFFVCKDCVKKHDLADVEIPLLIDDLFSAFDKNEIKIILKYFSERKEQIIIISHDCFLMHNELKDFIGETYQIETNLEYNNSQIIHVS